MTAAIRMGRKENDSTAIDPETGMSRHTQLIKEVSSVENGTFGTVPQTEIPKMNGPQVDPNDLKYGKGIVTIQNQDTEEFKPEGELPKMFRTSKEEAEINDAATVEKVQE